MDIESGIWRVEVDIEGEAGKWRIDVDIEGGMWRI